MDVEVRLTGPLDVNTYILKDNISKEAVIIDVGGDFELIKQALDKDGYKIKFILNTHGHFDHVLGESELKKNYSDIPIYMHKNDMPHLKKLKEEMNYFNLDSDSEIFTPDEFIDEDTQLYIGNNKIEIFHTPGHSAGSLSYYTDGKLFCGDALFFSSIGRTDFYDGDYNTLITSIKTKILNLPDDTQVYPGHGPTTTVKHEKLSNPYLKD